MDVLSSVLINAVWLKDPRKGKFKSNTANVATCFNLPDKVHS